MECAAGDGAAVCRGRRRQRHDCARVIIPTRLSEAPPVSRRADGRVSDGDVEGQSSNSADKRVDVIGFMCREADGASAARPAPRRDRRGCRRIDTVHIQGQAPLSALSHGVQHHRRSYRDERDGARLRVARWVNRTL